jgi:hypothetical protein
MGSALMQYLQAAIILSVVDFTAIGVTNVPFNGCFVRTQSTQHEIDKATSLEAAWEQAWLAAL